VSAHATFPQIPEAGAPPDIAALYADMRRVMRVPTVNLIHRHMAALPGVLPWAWSLLRGPMRSGAVDACRQRLTAGLSLKLTAPTPLPAPLPTSLTALLSAYNRGNGLNLVALTALRAALDLPAIPNGPMDDAQIAPEEAEPLPPVPRLDDLPAAMQVRLAAIAPLHGMSGVVPTLYLHLGLWPEILPWALDAVEPVLRSGAVATARAALLTHVVAEAATLLPLLQTNLPTPAAELPGLRATLDGFTRGMIPDMVCIGHALARLLNPDPERRTPP